MSHIINIELFKEQLHGGLSQEEWEYRFDNNLEIPEPTFKQVPFDYFFGYSDGGLCCGNIPSRKILAKTEAFVTNRHFVWNVKNIETCMQKELF